MNRREFEHVIRAAADVVDDDVVVIGSQAILAEHPNAPDVLLRSAELDVFPRNDLAEADAIDAEIGDGSQFHATYGYYAHAVGPETLTAPAGWMNRLVKVEVSRGQRKQQRVVAWCLSTVDLLLAKLAAGREHDFAFVEAAISSGVVDIDELQRGIDLL